MISDASLSWMSVPQLLDLALAEVGGGVGPIDLLRDAADDHGARRVGELFELLEMLVDVMPGRRALARRSDEQCALDGRGEGDQIARNIRCPC